MAIDFSEHGGVSVPMDAVVMAMTEPYDPDVWEPWVGRVVDGKVYKDRGLGQRFGSPDISAPIMLTKRPKLGKVYACGMTNRFDPGKGWAWYGTCVDPEDHSLKECDIHGVIRQD